MMTTPEITPLFRLKDLGVSDELMLKIEAYLVQHLVDLEERRAIEEIPGLDQTEIYMLSAIVRSLHLRAKSSNPQAIDSGIKRLLEEIGNVLHFGIDGNRPHTIRESRDLAHITSGYSLSRLRELVQKRIKALAAYLIPLYAKEAFETADQIPIAYLQLPTLFHNALLRLGIKTVADLIVLTPDELLGKRSLGKKGLKEIERALEFCGYSLA